jgi:hypothetical protein
LLHRIVRLQVSCAATLLQPGQSSDICITFRPTAPTSYEEVLALEVCACACACAESNESSCMCQLADCEAVAQGWGD